MKCTVSKKYPLRSKRYPLSQRTEKRPFTVHIDRGLFDKVSKEVRVRDMTMRQAIQWGLVQFIDNCKKEKRK